MKKIPNVFNARYFSIVFAILGLLYVSPVNSAAMIAQIMGAHYCESGTTNCCNETDKQAGVSDLKSKCLYQEECMVSANNAFCRDTKDNYWVTKDIAPGKPKILIIDYKCGPGSGRDGGVPIFKLSDQRQEIPEGFSKPLSCTV